VVDCPLREHESQKEKKKRKEGKKERKKKKKNLSSQVAWHGAEYTDVQIILNEQTNHKSKI
jgi:hypothetical protein